MTTNHTAETARERLFSIVRDVFGAIGTTTTYDALSAKMADAILSAFPQIAAPDLAKKQRYANHYEEQIGFLVERFAEALSSKLRKAEEKYQYQGAWRRAGWASEIREALLRHVDKGDPLDVAAYCAFAWHHGWSLAPEAAPDGNEAVETARAIHSEMGRCDSYDESLHVLATAITAAEARGREECAKIADDFVARAKKSREHYRGSEDGSEESCLRDQLAGMEIAIAIRAGGGR